MKRNKIKILHGTDVVEIDRQEFKQFSFAKRIMNPDELEVYSNLQNETQKQTFLASIFACKEAVMKAYDLQYGYKDITIEKTNSSRKLFLKNILQSNISISLSYASNFVFVSLCGIEIEE